MKLFRKFIHIGLIGLMLFFSAKIFSQNVQDTVDPNQNNFMTGNGKIYVVMSVVVVIVLGLFIYLINLDRKISRLEKKK